MWNLSDTIDLLLSYFFVVLDSRKFYIVYNIYIYFIINNLWLLFSSVMDFRYHRTIIVLTSLQVELYWIRMNWSCPSEIWDTLEGSDSRGRVQVWSGERVRGYVSVRTDVCKGWSWKNNNVTNWVKEFKVLVGVVKRCERRKVWVDRESETCISERDGWGRNFTKTESKTRDNVIRR